MSQKPGDTPLSPFDSGYYTASRTRRTNQNSSEESEPLFKIVSTRYRVASPSLRPLPLRVKGPQPDIFKRHGEAIRRLTDGVLVKHGLLDHGEQCADTCMQGVESYAETGEPTVLIVLPWSAESKVTWSKAVSDILLEHMELLKDTEFESTPPRIEMLAPERIDPVYVAAVSNRPDLLIVWDLIKGIVHQSLDTFEATRQKLTSLSLIHYGLIPGGKSNPITIYISVDASSDESQWDFILTNIENTIAERGWSELQVHIEHNQPDPLLFTLVKPKGTDEKIHAKAKEGNLVITGQYQEKINIGDDLGAGRYVVRNHDGVLCNPCFGTLGCYLEVKTKTKSGWAKVGLTNYHVFRPAFEGFQVMPGLDGSEMAAPVPNSHVWMVDENGWKRKPPTEVKPAGIESPSRLKHNYSTWMLRHDIQDLDERIKSAKEETPDDPASYRKNMNEAAAELASYKENLANKIEFFDKDRQKDIGIIAVSGFGRRTKTGHRLDWALIDIGKDRQGSNRLPDRSAWNNCYHSPKHRPAISTYGAPLKKQRRSMLPINEQLSHLPRIEEVWKLGAATGLSLGEFSEFKSDVRLKDESHLNLSCSTEYVFVYNHPKEGKLPFAGPGDSGSVVFDNNGSIVGLLFRGQPPQRSDGRVGLAYVTPIEDVLRDIKSFMGGVITDIRVAEEYS
ncbi:hypothetical protein DER45DRAFT_528167 [Fusarium avenaceum]|nr:hypothetical protein DER45DRAFT_528167 [Fusarium avenaceum]